MNKLIPIFLCVFLLCSPFPAQAQKTLDAFKDKPLPELEFYPVEPFNEQTKIVGGSPLNDLALTYQLRVPKHWEEGAQKGLADFALTQNVLTTMGRYNGPPMPGEGRSYVEVLATVLDYPFTAEQWFARHFLANAYTLQAYHKHSNEKVEALYLIVREGQTFVVRALTLVNGNKVIRVEYVLPVERWEGERIQQAQILDSFALMHKSNAQAEITKAHQFLDLGQFEYPVSWVFKAPAVRSVERMKASLHHTGAGGQLAGRIEIDALARYAASSLDDEVLVLKERLNKQSLKQGEKLEEIMDVRFNTGVEFAGVDVFAVQNTKGAPMPYEFWRGIIALGEYYYLVTLLTPARDQDFILWARNTETFKLLLGSFTP